jgi:cobalamin biosynthesis Mg chelatase CobN
MTFVKGQVIPRGKHLSAETKAKVIADRKAGKKWKDIAKELNMTTKRCMTWAKRKWYKAGMKSELEEKVEGKVGNLPEEKVENPIVEVKEEKIDLSPKQIKKAVKEGKKEGVVEKVKKKAVQNIDKAVEKQIKKSDKAPKSVSKVEDVKKDIGGVDKEAKTGLNERKSINIWFLVAVILVIVTVGVIFIIIRPKGEEKTDYNKPTKEKSTGFEGRSIDDL